MDFSIISEAINTFGFPAIMVAYFMYDRAKTLVPMINAVNNNTAVINKLSDRIDHVISDKDDNNNGDGNE